MRRNSTSLMGALHPVFFMLLVYVISVVLAFFVCRMIYFSIYGTPTLMEADVNKTTHLSAMK